MDKLRNVFSLADESGNKYDMLPIALAVSALVVAFIRPIAWAAALLAILALTVRLIKIHMGANLKSPKATATIAVVALVISLAPTSTLVESAPELTAGISQIGQSEVE